MKKSNANSLLENEFVLKCAFAAAVAATSYSTQIALGISFEPLLAVAVFVPSLAIHLIGSSAWPHGVMDRAGTVGMYAGVGFAAANIFV